MESISLRGRQKESRRSHIYAVAIGLFERGGFQATTASDIARAAGVSRGTFFNYYPYKEAVLLDYGAQIVGRLRAHAEERLAGGAPPLEVLGEVWARLAGESAKGRDLIPPLAHELLNPDPERAHTAYQALPLAKVVELTLRPLHARGELRADLSLERMANLIADTYLMTALRWSAYAGERPLSEEMALTLNFTLRGIFRAG